MTSWSRLKEFPQDQGPPLVFEARGLESSQVAGSGAEAELRIRLDDAVIRRVSVARPPGDKRGIRFQALFGRCFGAATVLVYGLDEMICVGSIVEGLHDTSANADHVVLRDFPVGGVSAVTCEEDGLGVVLTLHVGDEYRHRIRVGFPTKEPQ